jgi:eukaryotic-like serine/threonine-protein kinase
MCSYDIPTMATDATDPTMSASAAPLGVGRVVAETYEVTALLGQGGMGAVWAARHLRLPGKRVALKVLHGGRRDGEAYARFRREAEVVSRIGHPNIVEISDFNTLPDGTPYLVLEYLDGETLASRLTRGPLAPAAAMDVLRQVGSALRAAHQAGVVHRDLKPDNIFLCPSDAGGVVHDRVKVLDFGISKIKGSETVVTQDAVLVGTPRYMAPEQAQGKNQEVDARTDLFALGAITYEMLGGRPPFDGEAIATLVYAIVHEPHVPLATLVPSLAPNVTAAIDRALAKRPADRFADVASFAEAVTGRPLETLQSGAPGPARAAVPTDPLAATAASVGATPPAAGDLPRATAPRRPIALAGVGLLVAAIAVVALVRFRSVPAPEVETKVPERPPIVAVDASRPAEETAKATPERSSPPSKPAEARERPLAPAAAADVTEAEVALARGDAAAAVRLAQHSLYAQKSSRAFAVMVKARCRQGDLGGARAALAHVTAAARPSVLRDCAAHGMDLR